MRTIVLNSKNVVKDGNNNTLIYNFPGGGVNFQDYEIAINTINLYYSWFNINKQLYNNADLSYKWLDGITYNITIPNGFTVLTILTIILNLFLSRMVIIF